MDLHLDTPWKCNFITHCKRQRPLTDSVIQVKQVIVAVLFIEDVDSSSGDLFLSRMGIDFRRKNADGSYRTVPTDEFITFT